MTEEEDKIYVGSIGVRIRLETGLTEDELAEATAVHIDAIDPSENSTRWDGSIDGTKIMHETISGDIDIAGTWKLQAVYEWSTDHITFGNTAILQVYAKGD